MIEEALKAWGPPGLIVTFLLAALGWLKQKLTETETKLENERTRREALEATHAKALLAACAKMGTSARFMGEEIRDLRKELAALKEDLQSRKLIR